MYQSNWMKFELAGAYPKKVKGLRLEVGGKSHPQKGKDLMFEVRVWRQENGQIHISI